MTDPKLYRAFTPSFVSYMDRRGGWPELEIMRAELSKNRRQNKRDYVSRLRHGRYVPLKYSHFYLEAMVGATTRPFDQGKRALSDFVRERGVPILALEHMDAIEAHCCTGTVSDIPGGDDEEGWVDWIVAGLGTLATYPLDLFFDRLISRCRAGDPRQVATWTYRVIARERLMRGPTMDSSAACSAAAAITGIPFEDYVQRVQAWSTLNPWTVLFAKKNGSDVGGTIMLPLHAHVYEEIRAGKRLTAEVAPDELCVPSNNFMFESICENPEAYDGGCNPTRALLHALAVQHGALMRLGYPGLSRTYRFLAVDGTPTNRERMKAAGFKPTGTATSNKVPLWERVLDFDTGAGAHLYDETCFGRLSKLCPSGPPLD